MGDAFDEGYPADGEAPVRTAQLDAFRIDATTVTNTAFAAFVKATAYRTTAELEGNSAVFEASYRGPSTHVMGRPATTPWWQTTADRGRVGVRRPRRSRRRPICVGG